MIQVTGKHERANKFIHLPFDLSKEIEHVQFSKNRIRQSGGGFQHSIF